MDSIFENNHYDNRKQNMVAYAQIQGGPLAPQLTGLVTFSEVPYGTQVCIEVGGLPPYQPGQNGNPPIGPHGFHIHEYGVCEIGDSNDPFQSAGGHWNPTNQPHGNHAGDFPPIFSNDGYFSMCFFTNKFNVRDVIGKSVMIHENPDDFRTQPNGAAGKRLGCGVIYLASDLAL
ncbi:MAG: superoxide dismutase family protein [Anaerovoracaceae bacterium]